LAELVTENAKPNSRLSDVEAELAKLKAAASKKAGGVIDLPSMRGAQVIALKRLAQETAELYDELIRCKTPPDVARSWFIINHLHERNGEQRRGQRFR
jgi:hypothetical protein